MVDTDGSRDVLEAGERAREICLRALERRRHSRRELELKLRQKGVAEEVWGPILDRLEGVGLVNDLEFARAFVESRRRRSPKGRRAFSAELSARGVARDTADAVLQEIFSETDPVDEAVRALEPKLRSWSRLEPEEARGKGARFLERRGFAYDTVRTALDRVLADAGDEG
jgi:regulatory protein